MQLTVSVWMGQQRPICSPKHILNALNNDSVRKILRELTDTSNFLKATETKHGRSNSLYIDDENSVIKS